MAYMNMTLHEAHALDKSVAGREVSYHLLFYHFSPFLLSLLTFYTIFTLCLPLVISFFFFSFFLSLFYSFITYQILPNNHNALDWYCFYLKYPDTAHQLHIPF